MNDVLAKAFLVDGLPRHSRMLNTLCSFISNLHWRQFFIGREYSVDVHVEYRAVISRQFPAHFYCFKHSEELSDIGVARKMRCNNIRNLYLLRVEIMVAHVARDLALVCANCYEVYMDDALGQPLVEIDKSVRQDIHSVESEP